MLLVKNHLKGINIIKRFRDLVPIKVQKKMKKVLTQRRANKKRSKMRMPRSMMMKAENTQKGMRLKTRMRVRMIKIGMKRRRRKMKKKMKMKKKNHKSLNLLERMSQLLPLRRK